MYQENNNYSQGYNMPPVPVDTAASQILKRTFVKMTFGLLASALTALFAASSLGFWQFMAANQWFKWVLIIAELGLVWTISGAITRMSSTTATLLFYIFAVVNGLMLSSIFLAYSIGSIVKTFFITTLTFGAMSVYGYFTKQDLTKFGQILIFALIGLFIAMIVNVFANSSTLDWIISIVGVLLFIGLTAWDTQTIKQWASQSTPAMYGHLSTLGALNLYLDFINLFLFLLRFFGSNRD